MQKIKAKKLTGFWEKTIGLSFKSSPENVFFTTRLGIHTFFVKYPIDIYILDSQFRVRYIRKNLKPSRLCFWNPKYYNVLEVPTSYRSNLKQGTIVKILSG